MKNYKCTRAFTSSKGKRWSVNDKATDFEYSLLNYSEQRNFTRVFEDSYSYKSSQNDDNFTSNTSLFDSPSFDWGSSNDSSSSFSGGGGDFGGGGASGDW